MLNHSDALQAQGGEVATESPPVKAKPKAETATPKEAKDGGENGLETQWNGWVLLEGANLLVVESLDFCCFWMDFGTVFECKKLSENLVVWFQMFSYFHPYLGEDYHFD